MSDMVTVALIVATPPTIAAVGAIVLGFINKSGIKDLHVIMNSRLTELLKVTRAGSFAEGVKSEHDRAKEG